MADPTVPQVVRSYLVQLDRALAGLPVDVREEIVAGIREELDGLDGAAAAARIEALGDPEFIAAEARAEAAESSLVEPVAAIGREPRWYPVLAALLVAFGAVAVPVIGWVVGIAMVWFSRTWTRGEKWAATLTPFLAVAVAILIEMVTSLWAWHNAPSAIYGGSEFQAPVASDFARPGFAPFDLVWSGAVLFILTNVVVGIWLLWRARRSGSEEGQQLPPQQTVVRPRPLASWYAPVTILLIIGGGFIVPFVGWVVGVTMLWAADAWSVRDKWLGTLVGPLAVLVPIFLLLVARLALPADGGGFDPFLLIILGGMVLPTIANVLVGIRLLRRANSGGV